MYQSIPSLTIPPGNFLKGRIPHPQSARKVRNPRYPGKKNCAKTQPPGQLFSKIQQKTQNMRQKL